MSNSLYLKHYGIKGMKWGIRKQRLKEQKSNYKRVKSRLKKANIDSVKLQNYERGGVSERKVKKYLGSNYTVNQVNDYLKYRNRKAAIATVIAASSGLALTYIASKKGLI